MENFTHVDLDKGRRPLRVAEAGATKAALLAVLLTAFGPPVQAQENGAEDGGAHQTPLYGNLGPLTRSVTTDSELAQAYFNEGLLFMYAFGTSSATEAFKAAQAADSECAACFWGEAWSLAPYLNGGMPPGDEREAHAAITKAKELADAGHASEVEQALIDAFMVRFEGEPDRDRRRLLDSLYAVAMEEVAARFPDDLDVQTLYGEAWMLLRPRRGDVDLNAADVQKIKRALEGVMSADISHPGACHLYIHLVEASQDPSLAEDCADLLGSQIAVSHIRHMPSHIYMNIGRWGDAVRGNQQAWHADQKAGHGGPPGVYPSHNLHMLINAAVMDGQSAVAMQAAKDLARHPGPWAVYVPLTHAAFGRWTEILEADTSPEGPMETAGWAFARGMARLRTGDPDGAAAELEALDRVLAEDVGEDAMFRFSPMSEVIGIPRSILAGEIAHADGRSDEAVELLRGGVEIEDGLVYSEPRAWHMPVRHHLGAVLLESGRPAEAADVFLGALDDLPNQGWALFGLEQALRDLGEHEEADAVWTEFSEFWSRADVWLMSSRF